MIRLTKNSEISNEQNGVCSKDQLNWKESVEQNMNPSKIEYKLT